jgi:hypothetical protein
VRESLGSVQHELGMSQSKAGRKKSKAGNALEELLENNEHYRLVDLFNSKFQIAANDVDYKLNHD